VYRGELFNSITHLVATVVAIVGTSVLLTLAAVAGPGGTRRMTALAIYGAMLIFLYLSSTLYHSFRHQRTKKFFHVFDHCAIYLLIAGTYTPFTLVTLQGPWGWTLFGIVWGLAVLGVAKDAFLHGRFRVASVMLYVLMGWLVVAAFKPLREALPASGITWLLAGGLVYTAGILFFALSKKVPHTHGVWHLFVIGGSVCHYVVVLRYVALAG
jgi:hemolysin III